MKSKDFIKSTTLFICCMMLMSCGQQSLNSKNNQSIIYCSESDPEHFNPQLDTSATTADATAHQLYSRLLDFNTDTGQLISDIAKDWHVSDDGLTYRFNLRSDVFFHDTDYFEPTRPLNSKDILFSFQRWLDKDHPFHSISGGQYPYFESLGLAGNIETITAVNDLAVEIRLRKRDSSFLTHLATDFAIILSEEYAAYLLAKGTPTEIDTHPIGTGPYQYLNYKKGQYIRYKAHKNYYQNNNSADNLIFDITPTSSLRLAKLMTGECDAIAFPSQTELTVIREREDLQLKQKPGFNIGFWAFNTQKYPFNNTDVRRAMAFAIDKNTLLEAVYLNNASRAKTLISPSSWAYHKDATDTPYNPQLARKLLDDAGVEPGFSMTLWAMPVQRSYNPNARKMAELIQAYLADIDIEVRIVSYDWNSFRQRLSRGEHDSVLIGWSADNGDPDNFYRPLLSCDAIPSGTNRAMWCDREYDQLIYSALQTESVEQRKAIYEQVNGLLYQELPLIPIAHAFRYQAHRKELRELAINPFGGIRFAGVEKSSR